MLTKNQSSIASPSRSSVDSLRRRLAHWLSKRISWPLAFLTVSLLSGCVVVVDDEPYGELTVEWTIEGLRDGRDCDDFGARRVEVLILDGGSDEVLEIEPRCDEFGMTVDLDPGRYLVDVTLVDRFDRAVSFTRRESARIIEDTELVLTLDFDVRDLL